MSRLGFCALTGEYAGFVKCHLIPRALFPELAATKVADSLGRARPRRRPVGVYDQKLVTRKGEDILEKYDDYGIRFLRQQVGDWALIDGNTAWLVTNFDYARLKLFYLSILWRCAASSQFSSELIDVAKQMHKLTEMVRRGDPGDLSVFSVMSERYEYDSDRIPVFPFTTREHCGRRDHIALIAGFEIYITETWEQGIIPQPPMVLAPGRPWRIPNTSWKDSGRAEIARATISSNDSQWPGWIRT